MEDEPERSRRARAAAEAALVRVVHHYGGRPEFVVLGGLVPELLCSESAYTHAGTNDVDVQVDLEIACDTVNAVRLEQALRNAEFEPTSGRIWRWKADGSGRTIVKFEMLSDLDTVAAGAVLKFDGCEQLGAVNLRGTRFAARDVVVTTLRSKVAEDLRTVEVQVTGLAGFLLAKGCSGTVPPEAQGLVRHCLRAPAQRCRWAWCCRGRRTPQVHGRTGRFTNHPRRSGRQLCRAREPGT